MGVDLKWLVLDGYHPNARKDWAYSHTMMEVGRDYEYHDMLRKLPSEPVPADFSTYVGRSETGDSKYGQTDTDPYGDKLRMVKAGHIALLDYEPEYPALRAAIAYVRALPPDTRIAFYWH